MANRRMISSDIYNKRSFLELPCSARDLYGYLVLNTDNDGVVEAYSVMNMIKADTTSLRLLDEAGFVKVLNEDWVTYINNFQEFNSIDVRGMKVPQYRELLLKVLPEIEEKLFIPKPRKTPKNKEKKNHMGITCDSHVEPNLTKPNQTELKPKEKNLKKYNLTTNVGSGVVVKKIQEYINQKKYTHVDASEFFNYYSERQWICNGTPIHDWRILVDLWEANPHIKNNERDYDFDEIEKDFNIT